MPDPGQAATPEQVQALQEQLLQLQRENSFLVEEKNTLENLVLSGLPSQRPTTPAPKASSEPDPNADPTKVSVDSLVERVVTEVNEKLVKPLKLETDKDKALAELQGLRENPKTKDVDLYVNEMRSVARKHPDLSMTDVYTLAKSQAGPKKPAPSPEDLRTSPINPAEGADRFSRAEKLKTREQVDTRREQGFVSAFDDAWDQVMVNKG